ncbi:MAG: hypothetical protein U9O66_00535 [Patescibacteria group bacterium]|nr:hypothetical protein [Patescibacteria group bacterium]
MQCGWRAISDKVSHSMMIVASVLLFANCPIYLLTTFFSFAKFLLMPNLVRIIWTLALTISIASLVMLAIVLTVYFALSAMVVGCLLELSSVLALSSLPISSVLSGAAGGLSSQIGMPPPAELTENEIA